MLEIQKYLMTSGNSLETLNRDYAIKCKVIDSLSCVSLNYDQFASDTSIPMVQECRALILQLDSWKVLSYPFKRFFNIEENKSAEFDWDSFDTWEKIDGSLISFWFCPTTKSWQVSTRSCPDGSNSYDDFKETFRELVCRTLGEMGTSFEEVTEYFMCDCSYTMELQTPETQVVTKVTNGSLHLLAIRDLVSLKEIHIHDFHRCYPDFPLPLVQHYPGFTLEVVKESVKERDAHAHEGYVLMDKHFNRIKVKSEAYIWMSSRRDAVAKSPRARVELILSGKDDDVMGILPVFLQERVSSLKEKMLDFARQIEEDFEKFNVIEDQKQFALMVIKESVHAPAMFALRKKAVANGFDFLCNSRPPAILEWLRLSDDAIEEND